MPIWLTALITALVQLVTRLANGGASPATTEQARLEDVATDQSTQLEIAAEPRLDHDALLERMRDGDL